MIDPATPVREFFATHHSAHLEPSTAADYQTQLNHFAKYFAAWCAEQRIAPRPATLADLSKMHVHGAVAWQLNRGAKPPTADKVRRALLAIWNKAAELVDDPERLAPPGKIRGLGKPHYAPVAWTIEEFGRLLWGAQQLDGRVGPWLLSAWLPALLWIVYNSGLRISAAMAIRRSWVNVTSRRLVVPPQAQKDDEGRSVSLLPETIEALAPLLANGREGPFDDWPFDRKVVQWPALTRTLRKAIIAAGLAEKPEQITRRDLWHKIRRTFATQIYLATGSIEEVKQRLGHSSIEVSYRYVDFAQVQHAGEAELLARPTPSRLRVVGD